MEWITFLTKEVGLNKEISLNNLYEACKHSLREGVTQEDFVTELRQYLLKKVKRFEMTDTTLIITKYTSADIPQLFRYFKLGNFIKTDSRSTSISKEILYNCWRNKLPEDAEDVVKKLHREKFELALSTFIANKVGEKKMFVFNDTLTIKK